MHPLCYDSHPTNPPQNSPSRQAQEVQEGEADPGAQRDRGYLLDRNHLRNMPYFKPVHVSSLSRCPGQGARRGQSGSRGVRTLALTLARAHTRPRSSSLAAVGVCVHAARGGGTCAPAPSLSARAQCEQEPGAQLRTLPSLQALLAGELGSSCHAKLGKFVPTCNSGDATHGPWSAISQPQVGPLPLVWADFFLLASLPSLGFWLETTKRLSHRLFEDLLVPTEEDVGGERAG